MRHRRPVTAVGRVKRRTAITATTRAMASAPTGTATWALETLPSNAIRAPPVAVVVSSAASSPATRSPAAGAPSPQAPLASPLLPQMGYVYCITDKRFQLISETIGNTRTRRYRVRGTFTSTVLMYVSFYNQCLYSMSVLCYSYSNVL